MSKIHLKSLFERAFRKDHSISVTRTSPAYSYLVNEYPHEFDKTDKTLVIRSEIDAIEQQKAELVKLRSGLRSIPVGTVEFEYFINEYRQNSMMRDSLGNIVLDDATVTSTMKR